MKKKVIYSVLIVLFVAAIIFTAVKGFKVDLYYAEGEVVTVNAGRDINLKEISEIVKDVFKGQDVLVQEVELFKDSFSVKTTSVNEEQLNNLVNKVNEKYSSKLTRSNVEVDHEKNVRLMDILKPYILPVGISLLLILAYYAMRFKWSSTMYNLIKYLIIVGMLTYSVIVLCRIPVSIITMPCLLTIYALVIVIHAARSEYLNSKK